jgi:hypothetical protein
MPARVSFQQIAAGLTVPERVLLFCLASDTDWQRAGVTHATAQQMMIRGLIEREGNAGAYVLSDQGRQVLAALLAKRRLILRQRCLGGLSARCSYMPLALCGLPSYHIR